MVNRTLKGYMKSGRKIGSGMLPCRDIFGKYIRNRRLAAKMRQGELASKIGVKQSQISWLEIHGIRGRRSELLDHLDRVASALHCSPHALSERLPTNVRLVPKTELGKMLDCRRKKLGLSIRDFAKRISISRVHAVQLLFGKTCKIGFEVKRQMVEALGFENQELMPFTRSGFTEPIGELGSFVRERRAELGLTMRNLASLSGVSHNFIRLVETDRCTLANSNGTLSRLARALKVKRICLEVRVRPRRIPTKRRKTLLGKYIYERRVARGLTQSELGARLHITGVEVGLIELGKKTPNSHDLRSMRSFFGTSFPAID